jgi:hypothetical protein
VKDGVMGRREGFIQFRFRVVLWVVWRRCISFVESSDDKYVRVGGLGKEEIEGGRKRGGSERGKARAREGKRAGVCLMTFTVGSNPYKSVVS